MRESYDEGVANHIGPESCDGSSDAMAEALTGVRAGQALSREMLVDSGVQTIWVSRKATPGMSLTRDTMGPCTVGDLGMHGNTLHGNREILCPPSAKGYEGRRFCCQEGIQQGEMIGALLRRNSPFI